MGKNKKIKKKNIFKVAGAKSLKPKSKAKAFKGNLKKIQETLRHNISKIDKDLKHLEEDMRKKHEEKIKDSDNLCKAEQIKNVTTETKVESQNVLQKLSQIKF